MKYSEDEDEDEDENDSEADEKQKQEEEETTVRASRSNASNVSSKVASSLPSGNKKKVEGENSNSLGRFGFSVLSDESAAKLKNNSVEDTRPRRNSAQQSVRSSSRIATTIEKRQSEENSSPDDVSRAVKASKRSSALKIEESDEEESSTCIRKSSRARSFSTGYADPHSDDEFYGGIAPELKKSSKAKKETLKSPTKKTMVTADSDSSESDCVEVRIEGDPESEEVRSDANSEGNREDEVGDDDDSTSEKSTEDNDNDHDDVEYKIQQILSRQSMTPAMWQAVCGPMNTR